MNKQNISAIGISLVLVAFATLTALFSISTALIILIGGIFALSVFINPFIGFLAFILLIFIRPQEFMPGLEKLHIVQLVAILTLLAHFTRKIFERENISILLSRQHLMMLILLFIIPLSHISNFHFESTWESFSEFLTTFLLFFIIVDVIDSEKKLHLTVSVMILAVITLSINSIVQFHRGFDFLGNPLVADRVRWVGVFENPNDFALLVVSFVPFVPCGPETVSV